MPRHDKFKDPAKPFYMLQSLRRWLFTNKRFMWLEIDREGWQMDVGHLLHNAEDYNYKNQEFFLKDVHMALDVILPKIDMNNLPPLIAHQEWVDPFLIRTFRIARQYRPKTGWKLAFHVLKMLTANDTNLDVAQKDKDNAILFSIAILNGYVPIPAPFYSEKQQAQIYIRQGATETEALEWAKRSFKSENYKASQQYQLTAAERAEFMPYVESMILQDKVPMDCKHRAYALVITAAAYYPDELSENYGKTMAKFAAEGLDFAKDVRTTLGLMDNLGPYEKAAAAIICKIYPAVFADYRAAMDERIAKLRARQVTKQPADQPTVK